MNSLETKMSSLDSKMNSKMTVLESKIESLATKNSGKFASLDNSIGEIKASQGFIAKQFEDQKARAENLLKKDVVRDSEIREMKNQIGDLQNQLNQETVSRNQLAQYHRSSVNVIIAGIPQQQGEEEDNKKTLQIIAKLATAANFTNFSTDSIDVCHRLRARKGNPSIIVRFKTKSARMNFYLQRKQLRNLTVDTLLGLGMPPDDEVTFGREKRSKNFIYIMESLTPLNGELLRDAKLVAKDKGYKFFGYTFNGEVRVKKSEESNYIAIKCRSDLDNIL